MNMESDSLIKIYTDGACSGNPGPGGWGVFIENSGNVTELSGRDENTTNNRMELKAVIEALKFFTINSELTIHTDSKYVMDGASRWIINWKKNNWKTAQKKDVKNKDLWIELDNLLNYHDVSWVWVKGHDGIYGNERADYLATSVI
jgi:ribonuclease HI|tara:strand:+ start:716 stop:1153 length:438 start_codon:yes stop_codon:yes gene_type:complete